jgi:predicted acyltransferase
MSPEPNAQVPIVIHPPVHGEIENASPIQPELAPAAPAAPTVPTVPTIRVQPEAPVAPTPMERVASVTKRAFSVDALRGLFLILMTLGFTLRGDAYPLWMYHRQMPPPDFAIVEVAGISWRDLAYGAFLFTMAAALPLTLSRRIAKGETEFETLFGALKRYGMLVVFALLIGHSSGYFIGYTQTTRAIALAGFVVMALLFTRRREDWSTTTFAWIKRAGWVLAIAFLLASPALYGKSFDPRRIDDIIVGLAFASLVASVIWYLTRENIAARLGVLGVSVAMYLGARQEGWIQSWWYSSPAEWAFTPSMLGLMTVVLPGTIAGDMVLRWMRSEEPSAIVGWTRMRATTLAVLCLALTPIVVVGAYTRTVGPMTQIVIGLLGAGTFLTARPVSATERMLRSLFVWGAIWLTIGLFLEPFEEGIRKVPETLSYFFTIAGLTTLLLVALAVVIDVFGKRTLVRPLIDVGHNPLLMYVLFNVLINSALEMIPPLRGFMQQSLPLSFLRSALTTVAVVLIVSAFSRRKIYWRT